MLPTRHIDRASGKGVHGWRLRHGHGHAHELGCQHKALHAAAFWGSEYKGGGIYLQTFSFSVESYSYIMWSGTPGLGEQVSGSDNLSVYYDVRLASNSIPWLNKARALHQHAKEHLWILHWISPSDTCSQAIGEGNEATIPLVKALKSSVCIGLP